MKYLKIDNGIGKCFVDTDYVAIDQLTREILWELILKAVKEEDFEMDAYEENLIKNKAHQIIYRHIYTQLKSVHDNRVDLINQSKMLYKDAIDKYTIQ